MTRFFALGFPRFGFRLAFYLSLVALAISAACELPQTPSARSTDVTATNMAYFKDPRTGLCFASIGSQTAYAYFVTSFTNVPCYAVPPALLRNGRP